MQRTLWLLTALLTTAASAAHAQAVADTLVFETVGDRPIDADDLAFDAADTLWASAGEVLRLAPGDTATWQEIHYRDYGGYILPLGADTLLLGGTSIQRSLDGGRTFYEVSDEGTRLFEASSGRILAGTRAETGVIYSTDRGATWAEGRVEGGTGTWQPHAEAFAEVPAGHPQAGRLVAACWAGMSYSDDGGPTWQRSNVWEDAGGRYYGYDIVAAGSDGRVYGALYESSVAGLQIGTSADGGARYERAYRFTTGSGFGARLVWLAGGADPEAGVLVVVENDGEVHVSEDGAVSWRQVGQIPFTSPSNRMADAVVGPDGRLYVAGKRIGPENEWVFRSTAPVVTAAVSLEAVPLGGPVVIGPSGGSFSFAVTLTNTTDELQSFQAWSEATGPITRSPVLAPRPVTLSPGASVTRTLVQEVPANAPPGSYTYTVNVGRFPGPVVSSASFPVVKAGVSGGAASQDWTVSGWDAAAAVPAPAERGLGLSVSPNPFRDEAAVSLTLAQPGAVTVAVYDVLGRRVARLHAGPLAVGRHAFRLDGAALPPGLYVVRVAAGAWAAARVVTLTR